MAARKTPLAKKECLWGHPMTPENTYLWTSKVTGYTARHCRTCRRDLSRARSARLRYLREKERREAHEA